MKIGSRIKNLRIKRRIVLKELAKKTGLTTSFLSQLERDLTSPSVSSLEKIAQALNTKVGYFFETEESKELVFVKRGMGKKSLNKEESIFYESLASSPLNINMRPFIFTLAAGAELVQELISPGTEKFGMVLKGRLEFFCDEEKNIFEEGDSIYCVGAQCPRRLTNIGDTEAKFLWIVFTPS